MSLHMLYIILFLGLWVYNVFLLIISFWLQKCKNSTGKSLVGRGLNVVMSSNSIAAKRSRDSVGQKIPGEPI